MGRKLDGLIYEWAAVQVKDEARSCLSPINTVERILRDPGRSTGGSQHRVHYWPVNKRMSNMSWAMQRLSKLEHIILIIDSNVILGNDGMIYDKYWLAKNSSLTVREFNRYRKKSKAKLSAILCV